MDNIIESMKSGDFQLQVDFDSSTHILTIRASASGFEYLSDFINEIRDSQVPGKHIHIAQWNGLEGNVKEVILVKG